MLSNNKAKRGPDKTLGNYKAENYTFLLLKYKVGLHVCTDKQHEHIPVLRNSKQRVKA